MAVEPKDVFDSRVPTPSDLSEMIKGLRKENKWTQITLAELSGLTERTIQRVENAEASSFDTRRALAKAFQFDDLDIFNKVWPFPNVEKLRAYREELDRTTVEISLMRISEGRTLRSIVEGAHSSVVQEVGDLSDAMRESFATLVDNLREYNDVRDDYSHGQRVELDGILDALLATIAAEGGGVGLGVRHVKMGWKQSPPDCEPLPWTHVYFLLSRANALPATVRVPREIGPL